MPRFVGQRLSQVGEIASAQVLKCEQEFGVAGMQLDRLGRKWWEKRELID